MALFYDWEDESLRNQSLLSGGVTGATSGAAIGSAIAPGIGTAIGGGIGAIAGLGVGYMSARSQDEALQEEMERQAKLEEDLAGIDYMKEFAEAVGGSTAKARTQARVTSETEVGRLGLTGAAAAEYVQKSEESVGLESYAALAGALGPAAQADYMAAQSIMGQEELQQALVDSTLDAAGGELEAFGEFAGSMAETASIMQQNKGDVDVGATTEKADLSMYSQTSARGPGVEADSLGDFSMGGIVNKSDTSSMVSEEKVRIITDHDDNYDYRTTTHPNGNVRYEYQEKGGGPDAWELMTTPGISALLQWLEKQEGAN